MSKKYLLCKVTVILFLKFSITQQTPLKPSSSPPATTIEQELQKKNDANREDKQSTTIIDEIDRKQFSDYIKEINDQLSTETKPCDDFVKYACARFDGAALSGKKVSRKKFYIEDFILLSKNESFLADSHETMAKNFYLSCKSERKLKKMFEEIDSLAAIGKWPIMTDDKKHNITDLDIAQLWGELAILKAVELLEMTMTTLSDRVYFSSKLVDENFDDMKQVMYEMNGGGADGANKVDNQTREMIELAIEEIQNFTILISDNLLQLPPNSDESVTIGNASALSETITNFDWTQYFRTFSTLMNLDAHYFDDKSVELRNPVAMQKIIDLIKESESRIVLNYLIWKYIKFAKNMKCEEYQPFWRPIIMTKLWNEYYSDKDKANLLRIYNEFERSFNEVKHQLNEPSASILNHVIYPIKNLIENFDKILSKDALNLYYSKLKVDPHRFYKNAISYMFLIGEDFIKHGQNGGLFKMYLTMLFSGDFDLRQHNKPMLYYFVTKNIEFWKNDFIQHTLPSNFTGTENCLPYPTEPQESNLLNLKYLKYYAADMQGFNDYMKWLNATTEPSFVRFQSEELQKYKLNQEQIYWLALVQEQCMKQPSLTIDDTDVMQTVIKHSKQLSDAFGCSNNIKKETCNYHLFSTLF